MQNNFATAEVKPWPEYPAAIGDRLVTPSLFCNRRQVEIFLKRGHCEIEAYRRWSEKADLSDSWSDLESAFNSSSLGLLYHAGPRSEDVMALLRGGLVGTSLPGAIAAVGCDATLLGGLVDISGANPRPYRTNIRSLSWISFEWPPILLIVNQRHPSLSVARGVASELREMDISVEIVVSPNSEDDVQNCVRRFFDSHLCQRRSKNRPRGGAKVGHCGAGLRPRGGRSPSGGLKPARRFFVGAFQPVFLARLRARR